MTLTELHDLEDTTAVTDAPLVRSWFSIFWMCAT